MAGEAIWIEQIKNKMLELGLSPDKVTLSFPPRSPFGERGAIDHEVVEGLVPPDPVIYERAAVMRRALTPPEARLWSRLKGGKLDGVKFRR